MATRNKAPNATREIREWYSRIGVIGGKKRQEHPRAKELNRQAVISRWRKAHPEPKNIP